MGQRDNGPDPEAMETRVAEAVSGGQVLLKLCKLQPKLK